MKPAADALVTVSLLGSEQGGRRGPTPNHAYGCIMSIDGVNLDVRFRLDPDGPLAPGTTRDVEIDFLNPRFARTHVSVGDTFLLREASVIGSGTVKRVFLQQPERQRAQA